MDRRLDATLQTNSVRGYVILEETGIGNRRRLRPRDSTPFRIYQFSRLTEALYIPAEWLMIESVPLYLPAGRCPRNQLEKRGKLAVVESG